MSKKIKRYLSDCKEKQPYVRLVKVTEGRYKDCIALVSEKLDDGNFLLYIVELPKINVNDVRLLEEVSSIDPIDFKTYKKSVVFSPRDNFIKATFNDATSMDRTPWLLMSSPSTGLMLHCPTRHDIGHYEENGWNSNVFSHSHDYTLVLRNKPKEGK